MSRSLLRGVWGSTAVIGPKAGTEQVDGVDALARPQVRLLLDDVPGVVAPRGWAQAEPPRDMHATADLAHRAVEDLELLRAPEPAAQVFDDLRCALALGQPGREQCPHRRCGLEAVRHPVEVARGQRLKKKAAD